MKKNQIEETDKAIIASRIKKLREAKNLKQIDMAEILNIRQAYYSMIETGEKQIDLAKLITLAREFDIPMDWFIGRDVETEKKIKNN